MTETGAVEPQDITPEDSVVPVYLVPLTDDEIAEREQSAAEMQKQQREAEQARAAARESAIAKLIKLGLTEDEVTALVP